MEIPNGKNAFIAILPKGFDVFVVKKLNKILFKLLFNAENKFYINLYSSKSPFIYQKELEMIWFTFYLDSMKEKYGIREKNSQNPAP